ncbi:hypothetical protein [Ferviditalea candida]|uniref:Uncharacterized protein n=1 Tax=Ferviditalea candida TaxID=3108399 RepID=A0ABU5ZHW8_9BACL|nr:hypothetical protein [Paenibacillaceae bacterium T2]
MNMHVTNEQLSVGNIRIIGVASSSVFLIGDTREITLSSFFDAFPEILQAPQIPGTAWIPLATRSPSPSAPQLIQPLPEGPFVPLPTVGS